MFNSVFGNLRISDIPYHDPIILTAGAFMLLLGTVFFGLISYYQKWQYLWEEWITTVDHKKIGIMYIVLAFVMLLRGFSDAILMRTQQALSMGNSYGYLPYDHFNQIFTAHGVIMIFFVAMPFMFGLLNVAIPLQIGARDVAFPYLNSLSFWLTFVGAMLVNASLVIGKFAATGWLAYPPLSELAYSPGVGVDYYIWALQISGIGTLLAGINFIVTILRMRCPGMTLMKMPIFTWTGLCAMIIVALAFPILTVTLAMLFLDRFFGMHFFTAAFGGNAMMYVNLIWAWGHPEVYILILPAFGVYSEITATFSRKKLFGYTSMVFATAGITFLSFVVWLHHFFTMGAGPNVNAFFGIATMVIAIPTGVKIFNWLFTMFRGRVIFSPPMLWTIAFISTFAIGGMTGVMLAIPGIDFQLHNSVFLVAHFHNVIIGGVIFGYFAGLSYWFPKMFGFKLDEKYGRRAFFFWTAGFYVSFMPLYILGLKGMTRRLCHYNDPTWRPYLVVALSGAILVLIGVISQIAQFYVSFRNRESLRDHTGDPWDGRTLEWSVSSPAPFYNFEIIPTVDDLDAFWKLKQDLNLGKENKVFNDKDLKDIHMPSNTGIGFIIAVISGIFGFSMVWHIMWLVYTSIISIIIVVIFDGFSNDNGYYITVEEIKKMRTEKTLKNGH